MARTDQLRAAIEAYVAPVGAGDPTTLGTRTRTRQALEHTGGMPR